MQDNIQTLTKMMFMEFKDSRTTVAMDNGEGNQMQKKNGTKNHPWGKQIGGDRNELGRCGRTYTKLSKLTYQDLMQRPIRVVREDRSILCTPWNHSK